MEKEIRVTQYPQTLTLTLTLTPNWKEIKVLRHNPAYAEAEQMDSRCEILKQRVNEASKKKKEADANTKKKRQPLDALRNEEDVTKKKEMSKKKESTSAQNRLQIDQGCLQ